VETRRVQISISSGLTWQQRLPTATRDSVRKSFGAGIWYKHMVITHPMLEQHAVEKGSS
jgi:hypothetical protein